MRSRIVRLTRVGATLALATFVLVSVVTAPPAAEDRATAVGALIRCPVCAGEPIVSSPAPLARDMMAQVRQGVEDGLTNQQIVDAVLAAYGSDAQLLDPAFTPSNLALWLVPALVLAGGAGVIWARRREGPGAGPDDRHRVEAVAMDDA